MARARSTEAIGVTRGGMCGGTCAESDGQAGAASRAFMGTAGSRIDQPAGGTRRGTAARGQGPALGERGALSPEEAQAAPDLVLVDDGGGVPVADAMLVS